MISNPNTLVTMRSLFVALVTFVLPFVSSFSSSFSGKVVSNTASISSSMRLSMSAAGGVVVTGSAGGVGFAYAGEFMDRGYDVVICDVRDCSQAAKALAARHPNGNVYHTKCDVSDNASIVKMGAFAKKKLGVIQYWINNAGVNGGRRALRDVPVSQVEMVVKVNLLGTLLCTKVAMDIMAQQVSSSILVVVCSSLPTNVTNIEIYITYGTETEIETHGFYILLDTFSLVSLVIFSIQSEVVSRVAELLDTHRMVPPSVDCLN